MGLESQSWEEQLGEKKEAQESLDLMVLEVFSHLYDSMSLWSAFPVLRVLNPPFEDVLIKTRNRDGGRRS